MLRRFEAYHVRPDVPEAIVRHFERVLWECGRYIPQVLHSVVGHNRSRNGVTHVWEHSYASPESYQQYMVHPYHANILDRYLLHDNPERITGDPGIGGGLFGYEIERPGYFMSHGWRRVLLLLAKPSASKQQVAALERELRAAPKQVPGMTLSVVAYNSMGREWRPTTWSHVWEQGFETRDALEAYLWGDSPLARRERAGWKGTIVQDAADFYYEIGQPQ
jgi:ribosomal protein L39E